MNQSEFRGFVQNVMEYVRLGDFFSMRKVCKSWWQVSIHNQNQWYKWLQLWGKKHKMHYINDKTGEVKKLLPSEHPPFCFNECVFIEPKILKTKPLYVQCFLIALRRRVKRFEKNWESNENMKNQFHENFLWAWDNADIWHEKHVEAKKELEVFNNVPRKRIKLNISKPSN